MPVKTQVQNKPSIGTVGVVGGANLTAADLVSKYQQKVNNYNTMLSLMDNDQSKLFNLAINLYDIQKRENDWSGYVGYALKLLCCCGYYYDYINGKWDTCLTPTTFVNPNPNESDEWSYNDYIRNELYPNEVCRAIGISRWDITDAEVNMAIVNKAVSGEMAFEYYDMEIHFCGEQENNKVNPVVPQITIPDIPISPNINIEEMTKGDTSDDKFIYAYTDSGVSKNNRDWRPMIMDRIAQQVIDNCPPGNFGHVKPDSVGFELPLPVITWIGATTELLPDGINKRCWLKGYVIPTDAGNQLKLFIRAKAIDSISVFGGLTLLPNEETGIQSVLDCDLKSIDISGKLKQGLNSSIVKLAGEMDAHEDVETIPVINKNNNVSTRKENNKMPVDLTQLTLDQIKINNPRLYGEMRTEVVSGLKTEEQQKTVIIKAGEMDSLVSQYGSDIKGVIEDYKGFAGEMAEAVGLQIATPTLADIVNAVKEQVSQFTNIKNALNPADGQTALDKANEMAQQIKIVNNTKAIETVNNKFTELTNGIQNEAVKNLVSMQFGNILNAKPEDIPDDFVTTATAQLETEVPTVIQNVTAQAQSLLQAGQTAGEMSLFDNLGIGSGAAQAQQKDPSKMTDEEFASSLGY